MKAKDLMIGDWVHNFYTNENYKIWPQFFSQVYYQDKEMERDLADAHIHPIPLTAEILQKNGFKGDKEVMQYHFTEDGQKYHFSLRQMYDKDDNPKGYSFFAFNVLTIIDYVHQLQHALKLCGIDKEIVL